MFRVLLVPLSFSFVVVCLCLLRAFVYRFSLFLKFALADLAIRALATCSISLFSHSLFSLFSLLALAVFAISLLALAFRYFALANCSIALFSHSIFRYFSIFSLRTRYFRYFSISLSLPCSGSTPFPLHSSTRWLPSCPPCPRLPPPSINYSNMLPLQKKSPILLAKNVNNLPPHRHCRRH